MPIPNKFGMSDLAKYDGTLNPRDYVTTYTTRTKGNDLIKQEIKSMLAKKFEKMFTKGALNWYSLLSENSIGSFGEFTDAFIKAHYEAQNVRRRMEDIFNIRQGGTELLQDFVDRFQKEHILLLEVLDNWVAFFFFLAI